MGNQTHPNDHTLNVVYTSLLSCYPMPGIMTIPSRCYNVNSVKITVDITLTDHGDVSGRYLVARVMGYGR